MRTSIMAVIAATTLATVAFAQMAPTKTGESAKGKVLTNDKGMTLYLFDKDSGGKSACNGPCAGNWPPLKASADAKPMGDYSTITRDDGSKQWAYKGRPALHLEKRQEARRHHRRRLPQWRLAHRPAIKTWV